MLLKDLLINLSNTTKLSLEKPIIAHVKINGKDYVLDIKAVNDYHGSAQIELETLKINRMYGVFGGGFNK